MFMPVKCWLIYSLSYPAMCGIFFAQLFIANFFFAKQKKCEPSRMVALYIFKHMLDYLRV